MTEKVNEIEDLLEKGNIHEAASKAIALLYSSEDNVGFLLLFYKSVSTCFNLVLAFESFD